MPTAAKTTWNPRAYNARIQAGFRDSVRIAAADAKAHSPSKKAGVKSGIQAPTSTVGGFGWLRPTGLGTVFEGGREGGYEINPSGVSGVRRSRRTIEGVKTTTYGVRGGSGDKFALKFTGGDGGFAAHVIGGPMKPKPYLGPAGARWAHGGAQAAMRRRLP